jgi:hypothetical protein
MSLHDVINEKKYKVQKSHDIASLINSICSTVCMDARTASVIHSLRIVIKILRYQSSK